MKTRLLLLGISSLIFILFSSCQQENDIVCDDLLVCDDLPKGNAKLKRILLFASVNSENPISIVKEYEYDEHDRISIVFSPKYQDGKIVGTISYDFYEYNSIGLLIKIWNFNANSNSPTGFNNLKNYIYTYSKNGKKVKEYIEYPQINLFEYKLYKYNNNRLVRIEKYGNTGELESYVVNEYDNSCKLIKEITYAYDNQPLSYTQHFYSKGLIIKSDVYVGKDMLHIREILKTYDENNNLIILESNELSPVSSMMSYVFKYEYSEE